MNANGFHPDGTVHIDHDHIVLAIRGVVRSLLAPNDLSQARPPTPGTALVGLNVVVASPPRWPFGSGGPRTSR